ncbi:hypothetical protein EWM64_g405 [Hericium alpestre]|uniref:AAA+ ATPase domain-containing protein n=1 Tax=Hericium alpestre TaxID=135208 RepID=A0A4Z0AB89_9AGAM|nr:hypothetical protein EWM64_g405 [Hericium alpestre]
MQAPLPDEQTQHARGPQTVFTSGSSHLGVRKEKRPIIDTTDSYASFPWKTLLPKLTYSTNQSDDDLRHPSPSQATAPALESEFDAHRRLYPAISRFFDTDTSPHQGSGAQTQAVDASQQHWNDKWRPWRAEQVLGNERRACYLRDWLSALRLHFDAPAAGPARSQPSSQTSGKGKQTARHKRKAPKRPQILREVKRSQKRRRDDELGWIVDDDDLSDEQPDFEYGSDDDDFLLTPQDAAGPYREGEESPVPSEPFTFGDKIHNTILLTGPPGSGKTAAVYACAEELGWEVFEVYAGIGKRGGANLDTLIGDVGKNHLVQRPRLRAEGKRAADAEPVSQLSTQGAFQGFWDAGKKDMGIQRLRRKGTRDGPLEVDEDSNRGTPEAHSQAPMESSDPSASGSQAVTHTGAIGTDDLDLNTTFRQSIVLFEEVDVLFKEDAGFWHAVVKFIKDCKRPVVMTCNGNCLPVPMPSLSTDRDADVTLVPTEDLPLQDILTFKPPPRPIVTSFLQGLCLAEGLRVDRQHLEHVLTAEHRTFPHDRVGPDEPSTSHVDLRQCINQCQFGQPALVSQGHSDTGYEPRDNPLDSLFAVSGLGLERDSGSREEQLRHLDQRERNADSVSQLDAFCVLWDAWVLEASGSHADDQNGYDAIRCITRDNVVATPEYYRQDKEIVQAMIDIGGGAGGSEECARHEGGSYESQMEYALDGNVPQHAFVLHRTTVFLEYEPWIRYIVREQMREREAEEKRGKKGRQTRNSKRRGDEWVKMSEGQEGVLVRTGLVV